jgi:prevent-host-death family protein
MTGAGEGRKPLTVIGTFEARARLAELLNRVAFGGERILIERHGKPVAGLVSADEVKRLDDEAVAAAIQDESQGIAQ